MYSAHYWFNHCNLKIATKRIWNKSSLHVNMSFLPLIVGCFVSFCNCGPWITILVSGSGSVWREKTYWFLYRLRRAWFRCPTTGSKACPRVHFGGVDRTHVLATESGNVIRLFEWLQATVSKSLSGVKSEIGQSSNNTGAFEVLQILGVVKQLLTHLSGTQLLRYFHVWAYCMSFSSLF